jgi:hypothetical protein
VTSRVYVAPVSFGLGDLVVSLPVIQSVIAEARQRGDEPWLVTRSESQTRLATRIDGLAGCLGESELDCAPAGRVVDLRDHPLQRDHWWGSAEFEAAYGPLSINDILARMCDDFGIGADFSRPVALAWNARPDVRGLVVFVTETDGPAKHWPADRWAALAEAVRASGPDARLLTRSGSSAALRATGIDDLLAPTLGDAVDILTSCRAAVGVDTGLTHIAVQQGTPTVTMCRSGSVFVRPWAHCRTLTGQSCTEECRALDGARAYNERVDLRDLAWQPLQCPSGGHCMAAITPEQVLDALGQVL